ncbi:Uncharacterised protein [Vibrio cholerae]|nr:Uncharacterised protein [Vibrio cholerae]
MKKIQTPINRIIGNQEMKMVPSKLCSSGGVPCTFTS